MTFTLPDLPYSYDALEPFIDTETMHIHHDKHHQAYINNLNATIEKYPQYAALSLAALLQEVSKMPTDIQTPFINNAGGHANHSFFWENLTPNGTGYPVGKLADLIDDTFKSFENFQQIFTTAATTRFGSGWAWLVLDETGRLAVYSTPNQNSPLMGGHTPLIGLDIWEHAYYLKYQNKRPDYINVFWKIVNWEAAEQIYQKNKA